MSAKGNIYTYTREQWMGKVYSVFQDLNDSFVSFHGYARCLSLVKWPSGHRLQLTFQCYLLPSQKKLPLKNPWFDLLIYLFIFFGKNLFQRNRGCYLFITAIKCCEMFGKKFPARILRCPKCIAVTKRKWQIVSLYIDTCLIALTPPVWRIHWSICSFTHICFISV